VASIIVAGEDPSGRRFGLAARAVEHLQAEVLEWLEDRVGPSIATALMYG
jgi:hypothetical protein